MNTLVETLEYFVFITFELIALFLFISTAVGFILMYIPQKKIKMWLSGRGIFGNIMASAIGALTPFCSCSTIPMLVGFLHSGVPFGCAMSFLIASPLLNPVIIGMLGVMLGLKAMIVYFATTFALSVLFGIILEKKGMQRYVKNARFSCGCAETVENKQTWPAKRKLYEAFAGAWGRFRPIIGYLLIGTALGAGIHGYMPQDFVLNIAGPDNIFAIPVAAILGIPLYIRAETAIPVGMALLAKGMGIGAVIALVIGGAGMSIPEMTLLSGVFSRKLVAVFVTAVFFTAVITGYIFNILQ